MSNASRAQIDLEGLARDLRLGETAPRDAAKVLKSDAQPKPDPLAELARIVGQDDPFRALLAARDGNQPQRDEAAHGSDAGWPARAEPRFAAEEPAKATPADAFDQYLASVERDMHAYPGAPAPAEAAVHEEEDESYDDARALRRAGPRRRFASVGAGLAVVALAVTGALTYRGMSGTSEGGSVPLVQADTTPLKVAPKVADGVEIPDQNRQIYDRNATSKESGQIKVVNREEQPLDVAEAARAAGATAAAQGTTPGSGPFEAFGEPRRVRTVSVKPEAPPAPPQPAEDVPLPVPNLVMPGNEPTQAAAPPPAPIKPAKPVRQAESTPAAMPTPATPAAEPAAKPVAPPAAPKKAPQRVASVSPETMSAQPETTQATAAPIDVSSPVSGFSVQLGVRNSAADARAAFRQMQGKYSQLAGKPELIRQAEVNGNTIYRVRVGPLSKDEASSLCSSLKGEGGQCFVAKN